VIVGGFAWGGKFGAAAFCDEWQPTPANSKANGAPHK